MSKHTPGPWTIRETIAEPYIHGNYWVVDVDLGPQRKEASWPDATATVSPCLGLEGQPISREIVEANARLIAAAPDLLAACEKWLSGETTWSTTQAYEMAARAVAKAKGGP